MSDKAVTKKRRQDGKLPLFEKISYGLGLACDHFATVSIMAFMMPFFTDFLDAGIKASVVGAAMSVARLWDAFTDPLAGCLSDKCRAKLGRRRPFIFWGTLTMGLFFPCIWMIPDSWSVVVINIWLFVSVLIFYTLYSIFSVPYEALGAELTPDYHERTNVFVVRTYVQQFYTLFLYWMMPIAMALATIPGIGGEVGGVRSVSIFIGGVIIVCGLFPFFFCKERFRDIAVKEENEEKTPFLETCKMLAKNKPLLIVVGTICFYLFSIMLSMNLAYFVNTYYIFGGDTLQGATLGAIDGTLRIFIALVAVFVIKLLADRVDKHKLLMFCVVILLLGFVGMYFTTIPGRPWLSLTCRPLVAIGEAGFWILVMSLRADVCDWDEYVSGSRNEGMIAAITNWVNKIAITIAMLLGGLMLDHVIKFDTFLGDEVTAKIEQRAEVEWNALPESKKLIPVEETYDSTWEVLQDTGKKIVATFNFKPKVVEQFSLDDYKKNARQKEIMTKNDSKVMSRLRLLYTLPQVIALIICFFILKKYSLTSKRMAEIREELEARRGKVTE